MSLFEFYPKQPYVPHFSPSFQALSSGDMRRIICQECRHDPLLTPSPDHSTFSRFRKRLSKKAMDQINSEILRHFEKQGLNINEGVAIDARLVKSAIRPVSNEKQKELREKHDTAEGKLDKNGKPKKFCRDLESDWTAMKDAPLFGLKEHSSVDINNGFILATTITPASVNDTNYLPYCTVYSRHTKQPIEKGLY
jgi:IS5 family transposase